MLRTWTALIPTDNTLTVLAPAVVKVAHTKGEARAKMKRDLKVKRLPPGVVWLETRPVAA